MLLTFRDVTSAQIFWFSFGSLEEAVEPVGGPVKQIQHVDVDAYYATFLIYAKGSESEMCNDVFVDGGSADALLGSQVQLVTMIDDTSTNLSLDRESESEPEPTRDGLCIAINSQQADATWALSADDATTNTSVLFGFVGHAAWIQ